MDDKSCKSIVLITQEYDQNCNDFLGEISCSVCRPGSVFEGSSCVDCDDSLGCFKCDYRNTTSCLIC